MWRPERIVALVVLLGACSVDRDGADRVFRCDTAAKDEGGCDVGFRCNASAVPFGGDGFCAPECTPRPDFEGALCTSTGERIEVCTPSSPRCADGLECVRTDVTDDEGICLPVPTCTKSDECSDPARGTCVSELLRDLYPKALALEPSGLFCAQAECLDRELCLPGTTCMAAVKVAGVSLGLPDLCVPRCDARGRCPPNFVCSTESLGELGLQGGFCIPGLLGFPCTTDVDCLVGKCLVAGDRRLCSLECSDDDACKAYDNEGFATQRLRFSCATDADTGRSQCVSPEAYLIRKCGTDDDCATRERCSAALPEAVAQPGVRVCRPECIEAEGGPRCPRAGGLPSTCYEGAGGATGTGARVCVPAMWGLGCSSDGECVGDLECVTGAAGTRCNRRCTTATDCEASRWIDRHAVCSPEGLCEPPPRTGPS